MGAREAQANPGAGPAIHLRRIDVLRGLAILGVLLLHWYGASFRTDHLEWKGLVRDFSSAPSRAFWFFYPLS